MVVSGVGAPRPTSAHLSLRTQARNLGLALVSVLTTDAENGKQDWVEVDNPE